MNEIERILNKIYEGEILEKKDIKYIKDNIDTILKREDYLHFIYSINDIGFIKELILNRENK